VFTGEYRHTVDDKGRIAVPVKFRTQLDPGSMVSGWLDDCLAIHTKASWDDLSAKVAALPITDQRAVSSNASCSRTPSRRRWTSRAVSCFRPTCANPSASAARPSWWVRAITRRSGHRTGGTPTGKALEDPQELAKAFEGLGI
jgi:hypothetical protein